MTDYILITSVTAEKLFGVFEESVRETCAKDYSAVQIDAWIARATPARWQQLLSGDLHFIAAVNQTSGELAGFASINPDGYLHSMFVRPRYQKKGIASFMLHALVADKGRGRSKPLSSFSNSSRLVVVRSS